MVKKGKKKKQAATASTSGDVSCEKSQQQASQQQKQEEISSQASSQTPGPSQQQQQKVVKDPQPQQISQQQLAWGPSKQQQRPQSQSQQQQMASGSQQQPQMPQQQQSQMPQQQQAWSQPVPQQPQQRSPQQQQQQKVVKGPQPQQISQQQSAWGPPKQQQRPQSQSQQQQMASGSQQQPQMPQQQQSQMASGSQQQPQMPQQQQAWSQPLPQQPQQRPSQQQQQQKVVKGPQPQQISQQQSAWGPPKQQQRPQSQSQQQQMASGSQQQPQMPQQQQSQMPQQQQAWRPPLPQQPQQISPPQQQAWGPPLPQQLQQIPPPQQQAWGPPLPQQQAWGPPLPQQPQQIAQQQARGLRLPPLQQMSPQQQAAWGSQQPQQVPQQQQQVALGLQQQIPQRQLQQQQQMISQGQPKAWGLQQQIPQQQQTAWSLQQVPQNLQQIPQTQPQQAWRLPQPQQQVPQSQQQQQGASTSLQQQGARQQQQKVSIDMGGSGDHRQVKAKSSMHRQPSTSAESIDISQLNLSQSQGKIELPKMSPAQSKAYFEQIPNRKNPMKAGTVGQKITVWTNMFQIILDDKFVTNAVHYDVTVKPFKDSKNGREDSSQIIKLPKVLCRNIFEQCRSKHFNNRFPAYDGNKNAYSANDLPIDDIYMADVFSCTNNRGQEKQYQIILKKVSNIDLSWIKNLRPGLAQNREQNAVQVLDIIMRHAPESRFVNIGRSLFWDVPTNENTQETLSNGLTLAHGGYLSGVLGWKPYLNVDVSHKAFTVQKRVLDYIAQVARVSERNLNYNNVMRFKYKLESFLKGLKVIYQIPDRSNTKRTHRIYEISDETSSSTFDVKESNGTERRYTMMEYFQVMKGYKIMYPNLPTLRVVANANKTLLPMELCTIVPDQPIRKLNEEQTTNMIRQAATNAPTRKKRIEDAFKQINVNNSPVMQQEFHLSVTPKMKQVDARILPPPELRYAERTAMVSKGVWRLQPFKEAKHLEDKSWTILDLSGIPKIESFLQEFVTMLQQTGKEVGMSIGAPDRPFRNFYANAEREITNYFHEYKHLKLIIVIIPDSTDVTYGKVKKITEMEIGVLTQCMKYRTLTRANPATVKNILLKINSKLNGVNHIFNTMPSCIKQCMLVGADVTHPSPDSKDSPSVAAVAASRDDLAFQYNVALRLQPPKQEMILDLENIISLQLRIYKNRTGYTPQRLIYYRDGVSEGQLPQVMYYEIEAIRRACFSESPQRKIQITCVVVQKRHHVRLFPTDERQSDDRNKNVRAGTIVDTEITHPDHIDFYLVSHASIQGTARPTKYRCLCNESNFSEDQLEQLTYHLCHMYARCTRSVSYPAPTYYAHLAAYRGRALLQGTRDFRLCNLQREQEKFQMKMSESPMFFV